MRYEFQRGVMDPHVFVELGDDGMTVTLDGAPPRLVQYNDISLVQLSLTLDRSSISDTFRCSIELRSGDTLAFDSVAYVSFGAFKPTAYRAFVEELHRKLLSGGHRAEFIAGDKTGRFALRLLGTIGIALLSMAIVILMLNISWWHAAIVALLFGWLTWYQVRGLRRNETRRYDPREIPQNLLPEGP
jgi:hypothetical protein